MADVLDPAAIDELGIQLERRLAVLRVRDEGRVVRRVRRDRHFAFGVRRMSRDVLLGQTREVFRIDLDGTDVASDVRHELQTRADDRRIEFTQTRLFVRGQLETVAPKIAQYVGQQLRAFPLEFVFLRRVRLHHAGKIRIQPHRRLKRIDLGFAFFGGGPCRSIGVRQTHQVRKRARVGRFEDRLIELSQRRCVREFVRVGTLQRLDRIEVLLRLSKAFVAEFPHTIGRHSDRYGIEIRLHQLHGDERCSGNRRERRCTRTTLRVVSRNLRSRAAACAEKESEREQSRETRTHFGRISLRRAAWVILEA